MVAWKIPASLTRDEGNRHKKKEISLRMEPPARASAATAAVDTAPDRIGGEGEGVLPGVLEIAASNGHVGSSDDAGNVDGGGLHGVDTSDRPLPSPPHKALPSASLDAHDNRTRQFAFAIASLRMYNPKFRLTPEVVEIMRAFFDDLHPDGQGTVAVQSLFQEIERLDPHTELVSVETRQLMRKDMSERALDERIDFDAFCAWVMRWKETSPMSIQNMYTSWAKQLTVMDFGLSEGDGMFVVPSDEELPRDQDELRFQLSKLLHRRRDTRALRMRPSKKPPSAMDTLVDEAGSDTKVTQTRSMVDDFADDSVRITTPEADDEDQVIEREDEHDSKKQAPPGVLSKHSMMTVSKSFVAGGLAGMVAKSALAPVDRIKLMFQVSDKRSFSFRSAFHLAKEIYVQDGFRALFRGNTLNIIRVVPYAGVQHSSFDFFRRQFHAYNIKHAHTRPNRDVTKLSNLQLVTAGSLAGGLSLTLSYPLDLVRARFMVQHGKHNFKSIHEAVLQMYRVDGARSFTRGLLPSLMGTLPYTGIGFTLNEKFKHWMLDLQQRRALHPDDAPERLHPFSKLLCSYLAACIAQTATYPMDTIRRRIQTDGFVTGNGKKLRYTSITTTARIIIANEGWRGFFKGVTVNWMRSPLATGISLTAYDLLKDVLGVEQVA